MFLSEYLERYQSTYVIPRLRPNTAACYRRAYAALPPGLLGTRLVALDGMAIQAAINTQAARHPRAAQLTYTCLHVALARAVRLGYIQRSPMEGVDKPVHHAAKAAVLTAAQLSQYLAAARSAPQYPLLLLIATMGLRRGEALGLTWSAVDLQQGLLHVRQQRLGHKGVPLKSAAASRVLPMPAPVCKELASIRAESRWIALHGWLCDTSATTLTRAHNAAIEAAGLPHVTLHGLRHTVATVAVSQGCPIKILQGILGHSTYQLTADLYADHLTHDLYQPYMQQLATSVLM